MANKQTTKAGAGRPKSREKKNVVQGIVHIQSTFNNTIVTISDMQGAVISWSSAGSVGMFKGTRKGTPFAAQIASERNRFEPDLTQVPLWLPVVQVIGSALILADPHFHLGNDIIR